MNLDTINAIIKTFFVILFTYHIYKKIININFKLMENVIMVIVSCILSFWYIISKTYVNIILENIILYFLLSFVLAKVTDKPIGYSMIATLIALAISFVTFTIAVVLSFPFQTLLNNKIAMLIGIIIIQEIMIFAIFKVKRLKNGITFIKNKTNSDYIDIVMINIGAIVVFIYCLFGNKDINLTKHILIPFIMLGTIMGIMIQKTFTLYYKQKLLEKNITDYKNDISERDAKIKKLSDEKFEISKLNHEFYNRQKSLELKVKEFVNNANLNTEIASELNVMEQINNLSKEYSSKHEKIKNPSKLPLTEITEIDDMFKYMQNECKENNINFELQINGNIHHMVNNIIEQSKLVTLIGDHIRDSIIAVKSSNNSYRSIIAILGIKDNTYEFCVHDTGIEFRIETLLKLGVEPITTHKDEGGTGIGFITTFETLKETNSSLIIEEKHEIADNDYTKAVIIRFDGKHEYKIRSYRAKEINKKIKDREIIVENI